MNEVELLKKMADAAKRMPVPQIDVVNAVKHRIAGGVKQRVRERFWPVALALSTAAAALILVQPQLARHPRDLAGAN